MVDHIPIILLEHHFVFNDKTHFFAPFPKSRLLAKLAKLLSRSPVSIWKGKNFEHIVHEDDDVRMGAEVISTFDCDEAAELPAGWRTSPKRAAPGLVTPFQGWYWVNAIWEIVCPFATHQVSNFTILAIMNDLQRGSNITKYLLERAVDQKQ